MSCPRVGNPQVGVSASCPVTAFAGTHSTYPRRDSHAELTWMASCKHLWFTHLQMVIHPGTNLDRHQRITVKSNGNWTTRRYANSRIANSQTGHLVDWSTRRLDNSRTGQIADWTTRRCHQRLCVLSFHSFGGICETASCPVRDLSSPRVDQSARCPVRELAIRELAYPRVFH